MSAMRICWTFILTTAMVATPKLLSADDSDLGPWTIMGRSGESIGVDNIEQIDYTAYPVIGFYTPDIESKGIRVSQDRGTVTVEWNRIKRIDFEVANGGALSATIALANGKSVGPAGVTEDSGGGLAASCGLGEFSVRLADIRTLARSPENRAIPPKKPDGNALPAMNVVVTTTKGKKIEMRDPLFATTFGESNVKGKVGFVVAVADGERWFRWNELKSVKITRKRGMAEVDVTTADDKRAKHKLLSRDASLTGKTDLGEFKLPVSEIDGIEIAR